MKLVLLSLSHVKIHAWLEKSLWLQLQWVQSAGHANRGKGPDCDLTFWIRELTMAEGFRAFVMLDDIT